MCKFSDVLIDVYFFCVEWDCVFLFIDEYGVV